MRHDFNPTWFGIVTVLILSIVATGVPASAGQGADAFLAQKCNQCHSIDSLNIKKVEKPDATNATKGPDLSTVGKENPSDWLAKWLKREVEKKNDKGEMKKHKKIFKGSEEELAQLVAFLATLK